MSLRTATMVVTYYPGAAGHGPGGKTNTVDPVMGLQGLLLLLLLSSSYLSTRLKLLDVFLVHLLVHEVSKDTMDAPLTTSEPVV